jgi:hypothetical protein
MLIGHQRPFTGGVQPVDPARIFHLDNMLCWLDRLSSAGQSLRQPELKFQYLRHIYRVFSLTLSHPSRDVTKIMKKPFVIKTSLFTYRVTRHDAPGATESEKSSEKAQAINGFFM